MAQIMPHEQIYTAQEMQDYARAAYRDGFNDGFGGAYESGRKAGFDAGRGQGFEAARWGAIRILGTAKTVTGAIDKIGKMKNADAGN
jgi:hypothetical protein